MRSFKPKQYQALFDEWDDPVIQAHMRDELKIIHRVKNPQQKTFIDLGSGHGRILPEICSIAKNVIAIEINPDMFKILEKKSKEFANSQSILGDITVFGQTIKDLKVVNPVLLILQNSLGTVEGDHQTVLVQMKKIAKKYQGEIIVSLYRQQALKDWGLMSYYHGQEMNGEPDLTNTNLEKGLFVSKTGYTSKWWTDQEINKIKTFLQGRLLKEITTDTYWIFHLVY